MSYDFWIILTGILVAVNCGLLGVFLILRKVAMVGDAISHAVLPGIVIAYLITGSKSSVVVTIGAALFGMLTTFLIELLHKKARVQSDASIGITFTWLFAIGVILVSLFSGNVDIDQECVLYGDIAYVPFDLLYMGDNAFGPVPVWYQSVNFLLITGMILFGFRGFFITCFDSGFAHGLGINIGSWHYLLMGAVSLTVVLSFNSVGAILVVAFLVVPPSTAYLISRSLPRMLTFTMAFGIISAVGGFYLADWWQASISGSMAVASGIIFVLVFVIKSLVVKRTKSHHYQNYLDGQHEFTN